MKSARRRAISSGALSWPLSRRRRWHRLRLDERRPGQPLAGRLPGCLSPAALALLAGIAAERLIATARNERIVATVANLAPACSSPGSIFPLADRAFSHLDTCRVSARQDGQRALYRASATPAKGPASDFHGAGRKPRSRSSPLGKVPKGSGPPRRSSQPRLNRPDPALPPPSTVVSIYRATCPLHPLFNCGVGRGMGQRPRFKRPPNLTEAPRRL
jgi:hypothetical protein